MRSYAGSQAKRRKAMVEAEKQACAIYEMICATSRNRALCGDSIEPLHREVNPHY
jgi:hypothetical protein